VTWSVASRLFLAPRSVTRLDGARGKRYDFRPHVRIWRLYEANVLYWRKYLWHCWDISAPPAVIPSPPYWIGVPIVIRRQGNCVPLAPIVTPLLGPGDKVNFGACLPDIAQGHPSLFLFVGRGSTGGGKNSYKILAEFLFLGVPSFCSPTAMNIPTTAARYAVSFIFVILPTP